MKECLITNEVCIRKKCKICTFDTNKEVLNMLEIQERNIRKEQLEKLNKNLPEQCKNCSFLEVLDLKHMKVKCFYRVKEGCILKCIKSVDSL